MRIMLTIAANDSPEQPTMVYYLDKQKTKENQSKLFECQNKVASKQIYGEL